MSRAEEPLKVRILKDRLIISIGINTLAHSAEHCPRFCNESNHAKYPYVKVDNKDLLADDIRDILLDENEAGDTLVTAILDDAIEQAYDNGSVGFENR